MPRSETIPYSRDARAVAAVLVQQADPPGQIPEQDQLLAEHPDDDGPLADLFGHRHRQPVAPEVLPARRSGPGVGQLGVLGGRRRRGGIRCSAVQAVRHSRSCRWSVVVSSGRARHVPPADAQETCAVATHTPPPACIHGESAESRPRTSPRLLMLAALAPQPWRRYRVVEADAGGVGGSCPNRLCVHACPGLFTYSQRFPGSHPSTS